MCATMIVDETEQEKWNKVQAERYRRIAENEVRVEEYMVEDAEYIITAYGTSARVAKSAIKMLREKGIKAGLIRPISVWPFPYESLKRLNAERVKEILCLELSIPAQLVEDIKLGVEGRIPISTYGRSAGKIFTAEEVAEQIEMLVAKNGREA